MTVHLRADEIYIKPEPEQVKKALEMAALACQNGWTKAAKARNSLGEPVHPVSPDAVCWNIFGAVTKAAAQLTGNDLHARQCLIDEAITWLYAINKMTVYKFNDYVADGQDHVVMMLETAAEAY